MDAADNVWVAGPSAFAVYDASGLPIAGFNNPLSSPITGLDTDNNTGLFCRWNHWGFQHR